MWSWSYALWRAFVRARQMLLPWHRFPRMYHERGVEWRERIGTLGRGNLGLDKTQRVPPDRPVSRRLLLLYHGVASNNLHGITGRAIPTLGVC